MFPLTTVMMSTYDGTLGAVVISTFVLILTGRRDHARLTSVGNDQSERAESA
jgi:hypothetical protein